MAEKLNLARPCCGHSHWKLLLRSKIGRATFQAFLKSEFSDENIEFWLICEDYKKIKSTSQLISRAKKIFSRYIQTEAPKEINIDYKTRELIKQNVKAPNHACFDEAQRMVFSLMEKDSNPRFLRSDFYRTLLESVSNVIKV
ncbi:LOW QUALITY PROTEIN: regulator of G-protein signaling 13 [Electrophorus electricus]|uniref:LOW QUALITY PROTEIN: regulator of G-protein signaling 13 n=1 Tax=Electrophorus electricus TaxID=8005 RepID=UPI0015D03D11|nr:LOW QUALITY PROTEIN: regulator of G-protein signaling 13 [Electrophorus electricus]